MESQQLKVTKVWSNEEEQKQIQVNPNLFFECFKLSILEQQESSSLNTELVVNRSLQLYFLFQDCLKELKKEVVYRETFKVATK